MSSDDTINFWKHRTTLVFRMICSRVVFLKVLSEVVKNRSHPRPTKSESLEVRPRNTHHFSQSPWWFLHTFPFQDLCSAGPGAQTPERIGERKDRGPLIPPPGEPNTRFIQDNKGRTGSIYPLQSHDSKMLTFSTITFFSFQLSSWSWLSMSREEHRTSIMAREEISKFLFVYMF